MIKKPYILAIILLASVVLFSACIIEYNFDMADPWVDVHGVGITFPNAEGSAQGWGGTVTVTLDLVMGRIENVRIDGRGETPSHTRELFQIAQRNAALLNTFNFLDAMSGATVTRRAIIAAGQEALLSAMVYYDFD